MPTQQVGIFAKYWQPGQVKTRLAAVIGEALAASLARVFLETLVARLSHLEVRLQLGYAPPDRKNDFSRLAPQWSLRPQCDGDLGDRMKDYFAGGFATGVEQVMLIGADCPTLPLGMIDKGFAALETADVALGPAEDGGYYLVAARRRNALMAPPLFDHGRWGDEQVLQRTLELARQRGVSIALLDPWRDVDEVDDLLDLNSQLSTLSDPMFDPLRVVVAQTLPLLNIPDEPTGDAK